VFALNSVITFLSDRHRKILLSPTALGDVDQMLIARIVLIDNNAAPESHLAKYGCCG